MYIISYLWIIMQSRNIFKTFDISSLWQCGAILTDDGFGFSVLNPTSHNLSIIVEYTGATIHV